MVEFSEICLKSKLITPWLKIVCTFIKDLLSDSEMLIFFLNTLNSTAKKVKHKKSARHEVALIS